jgi:hypothetical protein
MSLEGKRFGALSGRGCGELLTPSKQFFHAALTCWKFFSRCRNSDLVHCSAEVRTIAAHRARRRAGDNGADGLTPQLAAVQSASRATHSRLRAARGASCRNSERSFWSAGRRSFESPIGKHEFAPTTVASTRVASKRVAPTGAAGRSRGDSTGKGLGAKAMDALASRVTRLMDRTTSISLATFHRQHFVGQLF